MCMERMYGYIKPPDPLKGERTSLYFVTHHVFYTPFRGPGGFNYIYRILHIIKRDIRHNTVTEVEYETILTLHPVKEAVDAAGNRFLISSRSVFQSMEITSGFASAIKGANTELPLQKEITGIPLRFSLLMISEI
jgi:hypothetical protein